MERGSCQCSIIIPVFNTEAEVLNASFRHIANLRDCFECIIVDDGSNVETQKLLKKFCQQNRNCRYIRQAHAGVSAARNIGIRNSIGEWVFFCDADDDLQAETIYRCLESTVPEKTAFIYFDYEKAGGRRTSVSLMEFTYADQYIREMLLHPNMYGTVWGKLFRRDILIGKIIFFDESLSMAEDTEFLLRYLSAVSIILHIPENGYLYQVGAGRGSIDYQTNAKKYLNSLKAVQKNIEKEQLVCFRNFCCITLLLILVNGICPAKRKNSEKKEFLKRLAHTEPFADGLQGYSREDMSFSESITTELLKNEKYGLALLVGKVRNLLR